MATTATSEPATARLPRRLVRTRGAWGTGFFLALNLAAFAGVSVLSRYVATGEWINLSPAAYYRDPIAGFSEVFLHPLSIFTHPWMIVVLGLLLGLSIFVPVVIAVLYGPVPSFVFAVMLAVLGHAPVLGYAPALGVVLAIGCALAGFAKLRRDMPFLALILGLLPAAGWLALSALAVGDAAAVLPLQRWALYAPFLIAFIAAMLAGAVVLGLTWLAGYRPGAVFPVVVLLLAAPAAIFHLRIGPDELDYALIVGRLQTDGSIFEDEALEPWTRRNRAEGLNRQTIRVRVEEDLKLRRDGLVDRCEQFLQRHPDSRRAAAIRWLRAQAVSLQLDAVAFAGGLIKYSPSYPLPTAAGAWRDLLDYHAAAPQAALADWRLGELNLRAVARPSPKSPADLVEQAAEHLHRAAETLGEMFPTVAQRQGRAAPARMFSPATDVPDRDYYRGALEAVERLVWLMEQNGVRVEYGKLADANSAEALAAYLDVNPKRPDHYKRLSALLSPAAGRREGTAMGDNLKLAVALQTADIYERAGMLIQLSRDERTDAAIVANFELGKLALRTAEAPAIALVKDLKTPEEYFRTVIAAPPNPYQQKAAELLTALAARSKAKQ